MDLCKGDARKVRFSIFYGIESNRAFLYIISISVVIVSFQPLYLNVRIYIEYIT